jgi:hypothetical protein
MQVLIFFFAQRTLLHNVIIQGIVGHACTSEFANGTIQVIVGHVCTSEHAMDVLVNK